ncbi:MAG: hypothetical protein V3U75_02020 [Methylococcaceae bacterium]
MEEFHYRIPWRTRMAHPGRHPSSQSGGGHEFFNHVPLMSRPEPKQIDIYASLLDPFGQFLVRNYKQRSTIPVVVIADLSASMSFANKIQPLAEFTGATAFSAYRTGDFFSFLAFAETFLEHYFLPARWYKGGVPDLVQQLSQHQPSGKNISGMLNAINHLPRHRSLLFLVSDFHFPLSELDRILEPIAKHDVVPVVIWNSQEHSNLPNRGWIRFTDPESGEDRHLFMRPSLKAKMVAHFLARKKALIHYFAMRERQPIFLDDQWHPDQITRYFYEQ